jgi:hypothetical protein
MQSLKPTKPGDTFEIYYSLPIAFGQILSSVTSQIRDKDGILIETLSVSTLTPSETHSKWVLSATSTQTEAWALGKYFCDIKNISTDDKVIRTDSFIVPVVMRQTQ